MRYLNYLMWTRIISEDVSQSRVRSRIRYTRVTSDHVVVVGEVTWRTLLHTSARLLCKQRNYSKYKKRLVETMKPLLLEG